MFQRLTSSVAATALLMGTFALAQSQPATRPVSRSVTATGIVVGSPSKTDFQLRTASGFYRVKFHSKVNMKDIQGGDQVRVFGRPLGRVINNANVRLLKARASDIADDYDRTGIQDSDGVPVEGTDEGMSEGTDAQ